MPDFTIIEAKAFHCGQMARRLRAQHAMAIASLGMNSHRELRARFEQSSFRRAWLIDGQLAGLGGVIGTSLSVHGFLWLALSDQARRYPIEVIKEARRQLAQIMQTKHEIATTILPNDDAALRLAVFLGFHVSHEGEGQAAVTRMGRRALARVVDGNPDLRIPFGNGYAVAMGYHAEAA